MMKSFVAEMFGGSPIRPLQRHMAKVHVCTEALLRFVDAALASDWDTAQAEQKAVSLHEQEADTLKKDLRRKLPTSLFMAIDRRDLLEILAMQDKVANKAKDIAGLMLGRRMQVPAPLVDDFRRFVARSVDASAQALKAIEELDELLDTGFRGREVTLLEGLLDELDHIEHDTDRLQISIRSQLLGMERDLPPVDVIFFYQIIDWVGDLADRAQRVGSRLQLLVAK
jgi:predicted phosphate transport protein (TIGR00153 family)